MALQCDSENVAAFVVCSVVVPPRKIKLLSVPVPGDEYVEQTPEETTENKKVKKPRNKYKPLEPNVAVKRAVAVSSEDVVASYTTRTYPLCKTGAKWFDQEVRYFVPVQLEHK